MVNNPRWRPTNLLCNYGHICKALFLVFTFDNQVVASRPRQIRPLSPIPFGAAREGKEERERTQSPGNHASDKQLLHPQIRLDITCLDWGSAASCGCNCCYLFLFLMFFPCSRGGELISFLMVGHECLRQMNYAFLPYVISCQPGSTEPFGYVKTNYLLAAAQTE